MGAGVSGRKFRSRQKGGCGVGQTKKGKGTKWMLVCDGNGLPIGFLLESASPAEVKLAPRVLETVRVATLKGRFRTRPETLVADRAYTSREFRQSLRRRGIKTCIPTQRRPANWKKKRGRPVKVDKNLYKLRFKIKRSFAWRGNFRRLLIRWEHHLGVYRAFCLFALALICINALLK